MWISVLHPYLFSLYFILFLYAINIQYTPFPSTYRVILFHLIAVSILFALFRLLSKNWYRAALVTSLVVVLFNSYGHVFKFIGGRQFLGFSPGRADILASVWISAFILLGWWFIRKLANPKPLTEFITIIALVLLIFPLIRIGSFLVRGINLNPQNDSTSLKYVHNPQRPPDIYYLILDEYGRADVLDEVMSFDNTQLIDYLKSKGFYVAEDSYANYSVTHLSLRSSLNLDYLPAGTPDYRYSTIRNMQHNQVRNALEQAGYQFISFASWYSLTELPDADLYIKPQHFINSYEFQYMITSALSFGVHLVYFPQSRALITTAFEGLKKIPLINPATPKFIFAHIPAAHVPFVYGPERAVAEPYTFPPVPPEDEAAGRADYVRGYTGQIVYINNRVMETIDAILEKSNPAPVIIIQGDHGPESLFNWFSFENVCLKERMAILNAYYLPGMDSSKLYPGISPVNTFRLIFDEYFGTHYGLLEDRSFLTIQDDLTQIKEVTDLVETCQLPAP